MVLVMMIMMTKATSFDIRVALLVVTMSGGGSHDKGWRSSLKKQQSAANFKKRQDLQRAAEGQIPRKEVTRALC